MFFGSSKSGSSGKAPSTPGGVETVLGKTTVLKGELSSDGSIRIDGVFEGCVKSQGDIFIGPGGKIRADLVARNVTISGSVTGNVSVEEKLELLVGATLIGDIKVKKLVIEEGAEFKGASEARKEAEIDLPTSPLPEQTKSKK